MAKLKSKRAVMDTMCQEVSPGTWEFEVGTNRWQFVDKFGLNLSVLAMGDWLPLIYVKNLDLGVMYAWGYKAGLGDRPVEAEVTVPV